MHALVREPTLSAQDVFKAQYSGTLRWSVFGAFVVLVLAVIYLPEYHPTPYRLAEDSIEIVEIDILVPPVDLPKPEPLRRIPTIVEAPNDDPEAQDFPDLDLLPILPENPGWTRPAVDPPFEAASTNPKLLRGAVADYPEIARLAGMQGTVVVSVQVDLDGSVSRAEILKGVHPLLDKPALAAARKFRFSPGKQQDTPVRCWVAVPFRFFLH